MTSGIMEYATMLPGATKMGAALDACRRHKVLFNTGKCRIPYGEAEKDFLAGKPSSLHLPFAVNAGHASFRKIMVAVRCGRNIKKRFRQRGR